MVLICPCIAIVHFDLEYVGVIMRTLDGDTHCGEFTAFGEEKHKNRFWKNAVARGCVGAHCCVCGFAFCHLQTHVPAALP